MTRRRIALSPVTALALSLAVATTAVPAAEGMWTFDNLPLQPLAAAGFTPDAAWIARAQRGAAKLANFCSASFVSRDGLVLTNHHCALSCIQQLSDPQHDLVADGFLARERSAERRCPEVDVSRLETITDVTETMRSATAGLEGTAYQAAQDAARSRLTNACRGADTETVRCDVVTLYQGGRYHLYKYHRYADVRLAFAPEKPIAFFGGDPDNFNFPRYNLDMTLLRVYENGKPAAITDYFSFKPAGAQAGELAFVIGHPGSTDRQLTVAQLEYQRDSIALDVLPRRTEQRGLLLQLGRGGPEAARLAGEPLFNTENTIKVLRGRLRALADPALMAGKRSAEAALKAFVASRDDLRERVGPAWERIERAQAVKAEIEPVYTQLERAAAFGTPYFRQARTLVRGARERTLPDAQRLREFSDSALPQLEQQLRSTAPLYPALEVPVLGWTLTKMREALGPDDAMVKAVLGAQTPEAVAARLVAGTGLADPAERMRLWQGGQAAIDASSDPFIRLAAQVDDAARAVRKRYESEVTAVERKNQELIAGARFAQTGTGAYPDATGTLRLSYGEVKGFTVRGQTVPPFTEVAGLYSRATGAAPYEIPASWQAAKGKLNPAQRFNTASSHDIIGGNSGSPMINRDLQIVGLIFDGNMDSIGGAYGYDERVNRAVSVHPGAMLEALRQVYDADVLAQELTAGR